jgi:hypothetical protein
MRGNNALSEGIEAPKLVAIENSDALIQNIQQLNILLRENKISDAEIFEETLRISALGHAGDATINTPTDNDLSSTLVVLGGKGKNFWQLDHSGLIRAKDRVACHVNAKLFAIVDQIFTNIMWMNLNLQKISCGKFFGGGSEPCGKVGVLDLRLGRFELKQSDLRVEELSSLKHQSFSPSQHQPNPPLPSNYISDDIIR